MQMSDPPKTTIQLDINEGATLPVGQTLYYANNTMKVTKGADVPVGGSNTFNFYIHTLLAGGKFTLSTTINYDSSNTATLPEANNISDVYEVYYYKKLVGSQTKAALKIKTSSEAIIFYNEDVTQQSGTWTNEAKDPVETSESALNTLVNKIKNEVEIKLDNTGYLYTSRPYYDYPNIVVTLISGASYKGFKHAISSGNVNRITIHGHITEGITQNDIDTQQFDTNGGVFVYFPLNEGNPVLEKPLLICLSANGNASNSNIWYKRTGNTIWQKISGDTSYDTIDPGSNNQISPELKGKLDEITQQLTGDKGYTIRELIVKLDYAAKNNSAPIKYCTGNKQVTVTPVGPNGTSYKGFKHDLKATTNKINHMTIHGQIVNVDTLGSGTALQDKQYVYVYYATPGDPNFQRPYLICLSQTGVQSQDNKWYSRTSSSPNTWNNAPEFTGTDDPNTISALETKLGPIKSALELGPDTGYTSTEPNVIIDVSVTPTNTTAANGALYGIGSNQIKVEKTTDDTKVPAGYVRYKHAPVDPVKTPKFTLGSVKHNDQELKGVVGASGTQNVEAVYVYYKQSDSSFEFPLIVCVYKDANTHPYYKRGNEWKEDTTITHSPDDPQVAEKLKTEFDKFITQYEVKLEISGVGSRYTATITSKQITVGAPDFGITGYTGHKHILTSELKIEKISHNGKEINGIKDLKGSNTISGVTIFWVFYEKNDTTRNKPLILCYQENANKNWYHKGTKWNDLKWNSITVPTTLSELNTDKDKVKSKLDAIFYRQGTFKEFIYFDNVTNHDPGLGPGGTGPGNYGQFVDKNGENVMNTVLAKLKVAEDKVEDALREINKAIESAPADPSAQANKVKLNRVKTEITAARGKVNAITTGADFRNINDNTAGKGGHAKAALTLVNTTAEREIATAISYGSKQITKEDIKGPITAAKSKFDSASYNKVGDYTTPNTASPQSRSLGVTIPEGGNKTSAEGGENFFSEENCIIIFFATPPIPNIYPHLFHSKYNL